MVSETWEVPCNEFPWGKSLTVMLFFQKKKRNPKALEESEAGSHSCWAREFDEGT